MKAESPLWSPSLSSLGLCVGKGRTSSLQRWVGVHRARLESPEQLPGQCVEGRGRGF